MLKEDRKRHTEKLAIKLELIIIQSVKLGNTGRKSTILNDGAIIWNVLCQSSERRFEQQNEWGRV